MGTVSRVLVANRGEIAVRVIETCKSQGIDTVAVTSLADRDSLPARLAGRAVCIGPSRPAQSYLNLEALMATALGTGADALHPGYGFLAESPALAQACEEHGITFLGPRAETMLVMGNKVSARAAAVENDVPVVPGSYDLASIADAEAAAARLGYPVLIKAAAGGGGRGMRVVRERTALAPAFHSAAAEAQAAFGDASLYLERHIDDAWHIEVQVIGDTLGNVVSLGDRDCTVQRRYQKVIEEAPATRVPHSLRTQMSEAAVRLARRVGYRSLGTVEFIVDRTAGEFYFLEMNTRIQVEHPVTEVILGLDLVAAQIRVGRGDSLDLLDGDLEPRGHAIELRINAEDPYQQFRPSPGLISEWRLPGGDGVRVDTHCYEGYVVPPFYDSMLAKLIVSGKNRADAISRAQDALGAFHLQGVASTVPVLDAVIHHEDYKVGAFNTAWLEELTDDTAKA